MRARRYRFPDLEKIFSFENKYLWAREFFLRQSCGSRDYIQLRAVMWEDKDTSRPMAGEAMSGGAFLAQDVFDFPL